LSVVGRDRMSMRVPRSPTLCTACC
jgi:hypothetical protein